MTGIRPAEPKQEMVRHILRTHKRPIIFQRRGGRFSNWRGDLGSKQSGISRVFRLYRDGKLSFPEKYSVPRGTDRQEMAHLAREGMGTEKRSAMARRDFGADVLRRVCFLVHKGGDGR